MSKNQQLITNTFSDTTTLITHFWSLLVNVDFVASITHQTYYQKMCHNHIQRKLFEVTKFP